MIDDDFLVINPLQNNFNRINFRIPKIRRKSRWSETGSKKFREDDLQHFETKLSKKQLPKFGKKTIVFQELSIIFADLTKSFTS